MSSTIPPETVHPLSRAEWRAWLTRHHERGEGVWLVTFKKPTGKPRISYMVVAGLMQPAGLAKVEQAMRDGSWSRLDTVEALEVPPDLAAYPNAGRHFEAFPRSAKRGILEWILTARRVETRARRIAETARLAEANRRANQWSR